jgi:hypothetical protein
MKRWPHPILTGLALSFIGWSLAALPVQAAGSGKPATAKPIDVAICLDVSNSMDGLIASAKTKLWDIVNELGKVKPAPQLRVALFSYGNDGYDPKVGWIRKEVDLTTDLDMVSEKLFRLTTYGGTEYVTRVCRDAVEQLDWSKDKNALKIIFVCGNEPASQDPVVKLKEAASKAIAKGIVINPIYCGNAKDKDAQDWIEFAKLCGGKFASIDQDHGTVAIATPMDKKLIELSTKLNKTYVAYGREADQKVANQTAQDANSLKQGQAAAAARAQSKGGKLYRNDAWDLVDRMNNDSKFDIRKVPEKELCDELKKLTPDERVAYVKKKAAERTGLQKEIDKLSVQRAAYISKEMKKHASKADKAFDAAVRAALKEQAAKKGIEIPD